MYEAFIERKFSASSLATIDDANRIIADYQSQGFTLTLRQLYYQFVQEGLIPNSLRSYKRLGSVINDGRLAGLIDWEAMEDRLRNRESRQSWESPEHFMGDAPHWFHVDMWENQHVRPEVWIEKDALVGVIVDVCERHDVPYFACRGYTSQSEQYAAGQRFAEVLDRGQLPRVIHLGDLDPSGWDMSRDNAERLAMFARDHIELRRIALNIDQVQELGLPPNPTKPKDSRKTGFERLFGKGRCWELDALRPNYMVQLIEREIMAVKDPNRWKQKMAEVQAGQEYIRSTWERGLEAEDLT